jgi:Brp/Blh family beta-carotene 15,15'-monooxygenase
MNKTQIHGFIFSLLSLSMVLSYATGIHWIDSNSIYFLVALIFFLGVPHGALDPVFAKKLFHIRDLKSWFIFTISYSAVSLLVVSLWWIQPLLFMILFLIMSALHFSRDLGVSTSWITRVLYGGSIIVLPTLLNQSEVLNIFSAVTEPAVAGKLVNVLHLMATSWLLFLAVAVIFELAQDWIVGLEIISVALLALFTPPLVAFTIYFCLMHSLRHVIRTQTFANLNCRKLSIYALIPMLGTLALALLAWYFLPTDQDQDQDQARVLRFLFVGLASLTAPHMLLIDRVRYAETRASLYGSTD